jgi:hypothetical protein
MKKIKQLFLCFSIITHTTTQAQNNCTQQLNQIQFKQQYTLLSSGNNEIVKLNSAKSLAQQYCLSSLQVKDIASVFLNEDYRLDFAITAFQNVLDKQNFYIVYNAFNYFSTVFQLHDFTLATNKQNNTVQPEQLQIKFPPLTYPSFQHYNGKTGCENPINEKQFYEIASQVLFQQTLVAQLAVATNLSVTSCLATSHIMKIATIIQNENYRLQYIKSVYATTFDLGNFGAVSQVFTSSENQNNFQLFLQSLNSELKENAVSKEANPCPVNHNDFLQILEAVKKETFNNTRLNIAKTIISSKKCFSAAQIKELTAAIDYESSKLDFSKFAYSFCTDKENYFIINDVFNYTSSKTELNNFIQSQK